MRTAVKIAIAALVGVALSVLGYTDFLVFVLAGWVSANLVDIVADANSQAQS